MGKIETEQFLNYLANQNVAPSTQHQAFNALIFLYNQVLNIVMEDQNIRVLCVKRKERIPLVLSILRSQKFSFHLPKMKHSVNSAIPANSATASNQITLAVYRLPVRTNPDTIGTFRDYNFRPC